jgi:hypothetical protein
LKSVVPVPKVDMGMLIWVQALATGTVKVVPAEFKSL